MILVSAKFVLRNTMTVTYACCCCFTVGENDGMHKGKYFFRCPSMHGVIVPVEDVQLQHEVHIPWGKGREGKSWMYWLPLCSLLVVK